MAYLLDETEKYFKSQALSNLANDIRNNLRRGNVIEAEASCLHYKPIGKADFAIITAQEMMEEGQQVMIWLVEGLIPEGTLVVLVGLMKSGKTTFLINLMISLAQEKHFLGFKTCKSKILLISLEESRRDISRRFNKLGLQQDDPILVTFNRCTPGQLRAFIVENDISLVVIDSLSKFLMLEDENSNSEVTKALAPLVDISHETNCTILFSHHESKGGGEHGKNIRGAGAIFACVDQSLTLTRTQGNNPTQRILRTLGRYSGECPEELLLDYNPETQQYKKLGTPEMVKRQGLEKAILKALEDGPGTVREIAEQTELKETQVTFTIGELLKAGLVERKRLGGRGGAFTYCLVEGDEV